MLSTFFPRRDWRVHYFGRRTRWMRLDSALVVRSMWGGRLEQREPRGAEL